MKKYFKYFVYLVKHKKDMFIECWKMGLYFQAFTHDLSKFLPSEFVPGAKYHYGLTKECICAICDRVDICGYAYCVTPDNCNIFTSCFPKDIVKLHNKCNKHHWQYWRYKSKGGFNIPDKYIVEMICDWKVHARENNKTAIQYYLDNYRDIKVNDKNRLLIESILGINREITCKYGWTLEEFARSSTEDIFWENYGNLIGLVDFDLYDYLRNPFSKNKKSVKIGVANVKECEDGVLIQATVDDIV